jgi:hypothetical protein
LVPPFISAAAVISSARLSAEHDAGPIWRLFIFESSHLIIKKISGKQRDEL